MKKPNNKTISIYLLWEVVHLTLWVIARPTGGNKSRFFPLAHDGWSKWELLGRFPINQKYDATKYFQVDKVYDITEFLFYSIVPIFIYYAFSFWNKTPNE